MAELRTWEYDRANWPATFGRLWQWSMLANPGHTAGVIETAKEIGATDCVVLLNNSPAKQPNFGFLPSRDAAVALANAIKAAGLRFHASSWLDPKQTYVEQAAAELRAFCKEVGAASLVIDAEGEWNKRISNHLQFVAGVVAPAFAKFPCPIGVTSFASLPAPAAVLLAWAVEEHDGFGMPQAYGVDTGEAWQQAATVQPDTIAQLAWRTWSPVTTNLVCIVGAFGGAHAGWNQRTQLEAQLLGAEHVGFEEASYWSEEGVDEDTNTETIRRQVLTEVVKTGHASVVPTRGRWIPWLAGGAAAAGGAIATRRLWLPSLRRLFWRGEG